MTLQKNSIKKWSLILLGSLILTNCHWLKPDTVVEIRYIDREIPIKDTPIGLNLLDHNFEVVTRKLLDTFIGKNEKRNGTLIFIAMDIKDYEIIISNVTEFRRYIDQQAALIKYYEAQAAIIKPKEPVNGQSETTPKTKK